MTITSGVFRSVGGDRKYTADFFRSYFASFVGNGVFPNPSTNLQVFPGQGLTTEVRPGKAWISGAYMINDDNFIITHPNPNPSLSRIDRIIVGLNIETRTMDIYLKVGTPSTNPQPQPVLRTASVYELALADITIVPTTVSIQSNNIRDLRMNSDVCGFVAGLIQQVDTTTLFNQYRDALLEFESVQQQDFLRWSAERRQEFDDWYANIQDVLSGDVASNLLNLINNNTEKIERTEGLLKYQRNADAPLNIPTYDGSFETVHPHVLYFPSNWNGYRYWMAHTPYPNTNDRFENPSISVSNDGIQWFDPPNIVNPIDIPTNEQLSQGYHMSDTHLVYRPDLNRLECWYRLNKNDVIDQILRKTSTDGINWSAREVVHEVTGSTFTLSPAIIFKDGKYKMWYVRPADRRIIYKESTTAAFGSWSNEVSCPFTFAEDYSSFDLRPWHLDVMFDGSKYILAFNMIAYFNTPRSTRYLLVGESLDGINFTGLRLLLMPRQKETTNAWDNIEIYRAAYVKVGDSYRLYYSAFGSVSGWKISVLVGDTPQEVTKFDITRSPTGETININDIIVRKDKRLYTQENKGSYLNSEQLKFLKTGVAGGSLRLRDDGGLEVLLDNGNLGDLFLRILRSTNLESTRVFTDRIFSLTNGAALTLNNNTQIVGSSAEPVILKFLNQGVAGVSFSIDSPDTILIRNDGNTANGHLKAATLVLNGNAKFVEGAMRYNSTTKKHQGFDGTTWHDLY